MNEPKHPTTRGRLLSSILVAALMSIAVTASAQKPPATGIPTGAPGETWTVSRGAWIGELSAVLPAALCEHPYFAACFTTTPAQCQAHAATAVEGCLAMYASMLPEVFNQPTDGAIWGEQVGECAGTRLEQAMLPTYTNTPQCNDPSQWL